MQEETQPPGAEQNLHAASVRKLKRSPVRPRRESLVPKLSDPDFPIVLRGYDRDAVNAFLRDLAIAVAELEATQSSDSVIKSALEEVGEQTSAILQQAHDSAEEITRNSRSRAEDRIQQAEAEAAEIVRQAKEQARELDGDAERIWHERQRLIEDLRQLAEETLRVADDALERFDHPAEPTLEEEEPAGPPAFADLDARLDDTEPTLEDEDTAERPAVALEPPSDAEEAAQRDAAADRGDGDARHQ